LSRSGPFHFWREFATIPGVTALLLTLCLAAGPAIYTWTDQDGVEHFTDDPNQVPRGVKARVTAGDDIGEVTTDKKATKAVEPAPVQTPLIIVQQAPVDPRAEEERWRKAFREANAKVADLEQQIESDRKKVEEVNGLPVRAGFVCQNFPAPVIVSPGFGTTTTTTSTGVGLGLGGQTATGVTVGATGTIVGTSTTVFAPQPLAVVPCGFGFNPEYAVIKDRLEKNRRELVRAKEELADLDRRASFEAVPRHWRR